MGGLERPCAIGIGHRCGARRSRGHESIGSIVKQFLGVRRWPTKCAAICWSTGSSSTGGSAVARSASGNRLGAAHGHARARRASALGRGDLQPNVLHPFAPGDAARTCKFGAWQADRSSLRRRRQRPARVVDHLRVGPAPRGSRLRPGSGGLAPRADAGVRRDVHCRRADARRRVSHRNGHGGEPSGKACRNRIVESTASLHPPVRASRNAGTRGGPPSGQPPPGRTSRPRTFCPP